MSKLETLRPVTEEELLEASKTIIDVDGTNVGIIDHNGLFRRMLSMTASGKYLYSYGGEPVINPDEYDYEEVDE